MHDYGSMYEKKAKPNHIDCFSLPLRIRLSIIRPHLRNSANYRTRMSAKIPFSDCFSRVQRRTQWVFNCVREAKKTLEFEQELTYRKLIHVCVQPVKYIIVKMQKFGKEILPSDATLCFDYREN